jgi:hypothetical protein
VRQGSPCTQGRGTRPTHALSLHLTIEKEYRSVKATRPTTGILTPWKATTRCQLVVPSSSSNDNLSLVKHDTWVDLNPGGMRILYTQESALVTDSPLPSPPCYIVSRQRVGAGYNKVLIPNTDYKGKGHTESAPSNLTPRVK